MITIITSDNLLVMEKQGGIYYEDTKKTTCDLYSIVHNGWVR